MKKTIGDGKSWMSVELRERKWCGVLEIEKEGVECCWIYFTIGYGLRKKKNSCLIHIVSISLQMYIDCGIHGCPTT